MTYEEAKIQHSFWQDYYDNQQERHDWKDVAITPEQFFELWLRKDESPCIISNESFTY